MLQKDTSEEFLSYFLGQILKHACCVTSQTFLMVYETRSSALPVSSSETKIPDEYLFMMVTT